MGRAVIRLGDDAYIEWSTVVDAPVSAVMTLRDIEARYSSDIVARVSERGHGFTDGDDVTVESIVAANRAGPGDVSLTVAAILELYAPGAVPRALRPDDIEPYTTTCAVHRDHPEWGRVYWVPWKPGEAPERLDTDTDLRARIYDPTLSVDAEGDLDASGPET